MSQEALKLQADALALELGNIDLTALIRELSTVDWLAVIAKVRAILAILRGTQTEQLSLPGGLGGILSGGKLGDLLTLLQLLSKIFGKQ